VECRILSTEGGKVEASLRPSRLEGGVGEEEALAEDPLPEEGAVVKGYVVSTTQKGCFVRLSRSLTARVLIKVSLARPPCLPHS
jgi:ribosomal protein S1